TLSDSSGNYKFLINAPSSATTYRVREVLNSGWRLTSPSGGVQSVTLSSGGQATGKNFGDTQHVLISGNVFNDANGNKTKDSGEVGLSGFRVFVDANHNGILDSGELTTTTDSSGNWAFKTLNAGTYTIRVTKPSGSTSTYSTTTSLPAAFTLASGASKTGINFGEKKIA
ncbi:MAG TPA: SdrD B-like domain-containing protein, partial [Tepidisphaeraceae bacterium]|nr:SdrD B-like domain-containing protein [Tepidisphaeraceae bacterium]